MRRLLILKRSGFKYQADVVFNLVGPSGGFFSQSGGSLEVRSGNAVHEIAISVTIFPRDDLNIAKGAIVQADAVLDEFRYRK